MLTKSGYEELIAQLQKSPVILWVNAGVLSATELAQLRQSGHDISDFFRVIDINDPMAVEKALITVQEHHAGQHIWVERSPSAKQY